MKRKQYVKIKKVNGPRYWYADKIGEIFKVSREYNSDYAVYNGSIDACLVAKEDAELIITEKRPAKKGEKVLVTTPPTYEEVEVVGTFSNSPVERDYSGVFVRVVLGTRSEYLSDEQYEVIVNNEVKNEEADEMENKLLIENAKTVFEKKGDKYFGYKSRLGDIVIGGNYSYAFIVHYAKTNEDVVIIPGDVNTVTTPVCTTEAERLWKLEKTAQERRDEIVEQAKADVERLRTNNRLWRTFDITFDINRESRTVEAVAKKPNSRTAFYGTAICAPDDCFNIHIGEAIALHRALGLEVPDEYLNAPQPTEVRVGDVVMSIADKSKVYVIVDDEKRLIDGEAARTSIVAEYGKIIDDSRTGVEE